ncbi:hypothetical protein K1T71_014421 [Dendrolimus kikuchii]|uniref:Uncharacterized protein n=1 Tax=Dendrolimus kikuchii TaxID=765133 RepID=A0ACC1CDZ1_9NEOP|nr:hypothetical protein K1T71_014421 [Dendrolimus kikuchii]
MEEENFIGCISCMSTSDLYDLFAIYPDNGETFASLLYKSFDIKIPDTSNLKYLCSECAHQLETAANFKDQLLKSLAALQIIKEEEEYLDESILAEEENVAPEDESSQMTNRNDEDYEDDYNEEDIDDEHAIQSIDETLCIYCSCRLPTASAVEEHIRTTHELEPRTGRPLRQCGLCGLSMADPERHYARCHGATSDSESRKYPCHFCDNVYVSKKACFTHLRMKHGLKLCTDQSNKYIPRERKKCHMCPRDFSQKQILNKHLWKAHGFEVEKRKAFICPLCDERVSYGSHFSAHLLHVHRVHEQVEQLEFHTMEDFMLFKGAIQEETKYRFRKTTASKQTIEGVRSHYMCSQSGVYVYQGKGKRPAPERQIYKTGKACPAHMIVTETLDRVLVTFYKTHVGHGTCPYFEPREPKKPRISQEPIVIEEFKEEDEISNSEESPSVICDLCGMACEDREQFGEHLAANHSHEDGYPCQYCEEAFQNLDEWTTHIRREHNMDSLF